MPRTLLVQPVIVVNAQNPKKYVFAPGNELPLNILYLASYLGEHALEHQILDMRMHSDPWSVLESLIESFEPDKVLRIFPEPTGHFISEWGSSRNIWNF